MKDWAKKEVELACKYERDNSQEEDSWDYGCSCYKSALKAYESLTDDKHNETSLKVTKDILNRLLINKPLTPIEDTGDWMFTISSEYPEDIEGIYQCERLSSLFKYEYLDGTVKYRDVNSFYCINIHDEKDVFSDYLVQDLIDSLFPITMPYFPANEPYRVYCEKFIVDEKLRHYDIYDTLGIFYIIKPNGEKVYIDLFYKDNGNGSNMEKITRTEYYERFYNAHSGVNN